MPLPTYDSIRHLLLAELNGDSPAGGQSIREALGRQIPMHTDTVIYVGKNEESPSVINKFNVGVD